MQILRRAHEIEIRTARELVHLNVDADVPVLRLDDVGDRRPRVAERGEHERELLAVLLADTAGARLPAGVIEQLLRLRLIEWVARLELVEPRPDTFGEHADGRPVHAEVELVHDCLAIDREVQRLAHRELVRGRTLDVDEESDRRPTADGLDEGEARIGLETGVVGLSDLINEQALSGFERRRPGARFGHRAEADLVQVGALLVAEEIGGPRVIGVRFQRDDAVG